ncbi:MAG TPA: hypothetical protein VFF04_00840 [Candidatus Babeliales bacterium]|nr:hypothetical protein [Candidatus Babeliales bacterium]
MNNAINIAYRMLYYTYGIIPIIAGFDKYCDFLVDWDIYLNESIPLCLGITQDTFMYTAGAIEILAGLLVFIRPQIGGYVVSAWLILISINIISMGSHHHEGCVHSVTHYDVAVRDIAMAVGAYVLVLLAKALQERDKKISR